MLQDVELAARLSTDFTREEFKGFLRFDAAGVTGKWYEWENFLEEWVVQALDRHIIEPSFFCTPATKGRSFTSMLLAAGEVLPSAVYGIIIPKYNITLGVSDAHENPYLQKFYRLIAGTILIGFPKGRLKVQSAAWPY